MNVNEDVGIGGVVVVGGGVAAVVAVDLALTNAPLARFALKYRKYIR